MPSRLLLALLLLVAACNNQYCARNTDCAANQMCSIEGKCVVATSDSDAGADDGSTPTVDAGTTDAAIDAAVDAAIDGGP